MAESTASAASDDEEPRSVYVIEIAPRWYSAIGPEVAEGMQCLYVGESKSPPGKRFTQHRRGHGFRKRGGTAAASPFRVIAAARRSAGLTGTLIDGEDAWLRRDLMERLAPEPAVGKAAALALELATAERLRSDGYFVIGPKPPRAERRKRNRAQA